MGKNLTIQERLNTIICLEIKELKDVLDKWFNEDKDRTAMDFGDNLDNVPVLNRLYDGIARSYYVKRIGVAHEGYYLVLNYIGCDLCEENNTIQYLDQDRENFIPGELDKLTEFVNKWINPTEPIYHFTDKQKAAIKQFDSVLKKLDELNVYVLPDTEDKIFYFANGAKGCFFDGAEGYVETGQYELVGDVDLDRLQKSEMGFDAEFMSSEGLELIKEK